MNNTVGFPLAGFTGLWVLLLCAPLLFGHSPNTYQITPDQTTMLVGVSPQNENVRFVQSRNVRFHGWPRAPWKRSESL
jgi:hypothetical protein